MNQGYNVLFSAKSFRKLNTLTWRYQILFLIGIKLFYNIFFINNMVLYYFSFFFMLNWCLLGFVLSIVFAASPKECGKCTECLRSYKESKIQFVEYNRMETIHFFTFLQFLKNKNKNKKRRRRRRITTTMTTDNRSQCSAFILSSTICKHIYSTSSMDWQWWLHEYQIW